MQRVAWWIALLLVVSACSAGDGDADSAAPVPAGNAASFCARWPEARSIIVQDISRGADANFKAAAVVVTETLDEIGFAVPPEIRDLWEVATGYRRTAATLLEIAGSPEAIRAELITAAFAGADPAAVESGALAAVAALDAWAIEQCGDFCDLWPRLERALGWPLRGEEGADFEMLQATGRDDAALLSLADPLVPAEVRENWDTIAGIKLALVDVIRPLEGPEDWGPELHERSSQILDPVRLWESTMDENFDQAMERLFGEERQGGEEWRLPEIVEQALVGEIGAWAEANCEAVGTSGLPGLITVHTNEDGGQRAEGTLLVVALPVGRDIRSFDSARGYLGALCFDEFPGRHSDRPTVLLEREAGFEQPCAWLQGFDHGGPRPAVFDAGKYDLFFGLFTGGLGEFEHYIPAPASCKTARVVVDGDTDVDVPVLEPCDIGYLAGTPEEFARRHPPLPEGQTGSLTLVVTDFEFPVDPEDGRHGGGIRVVVLPGGTTLNAVGRGEVWPSGAGCLAFPGSEHFQEPDPEGADQAREDADQMILIADEARENAERTRGEAEAALGEAERMGQEAERAEEEANQLSEEADLAGDEANRLREEADLAGDEANRLREEADRAAEEANRLREEAEQAAGHAQGMREEAESVWGEADWMRQEAERAEDEAVWMREEADRARDNAEQAAGEDQFRELDLVRAKGVELVVGGFPASGDPYRSPCPFILELLHEPWRNNEVVRLAFGSYDVHVEWAWYGDEGETYECARFAVEIDGDVVVAAPEKGECP